MAKIYGLFGSMQGKVADVVMAVRNGEQIVRRYQPIVNNPNTQAQIAARARLKLMSQLSAVMAPVIAIPREGIVTSRNLFVKQNYPSTSYATDTATINLAAVQITKSVVGLPGLSVAREQNSLTVRLQSQSATGVNVDRVVYALFEKQGDNKLRLVNTAVSSTPGASLNYEQNFPITGSSSYVIYGYGVRDNSETARVIFGNLVVPTAQAVANLVVSRTLTNADITLTETRFVASEPTTLNLT